MDDGGGRRFRRPSSHNGTVTSETVLHTARARILADLTARDVAGPEIVSLVEDALSRRRWWLEQWQEGAAFVPGLLAQDVQDALMETYGRWPLCPLCEEPHALAVEPELGEDPHWVCEARGVPVAAVGSLEGGPTQYGPAR
ncbi:hypothetical protein SAMN05216259_106259 [Actinacidiphila guanduensis]|uniref:Uncharacterized protein n=1 Tax=Actinacidiphila guanduensis TaxID=310781 RepID=A0A1H0FE76_9ACTN|nr:hypothetical protein SAMN05216259_106259 [Actinacidiphila guanduensis]